MARTATTYEGVEKGDRKDLAAKDPNEMHQRMARYLTYRTGVQVDPKQVQIVRVLLTDFQRSPEEAAIREQKASEQPAPAPAKQTAKAATGKAKQSAAKPAARRGKSAADKPAAPRRSRAGGGRSKAAAAQAENPAVDSGTEEQDPF